jgi:hypothetical protein
MSQIVSEEVVAPGRWVSFKTIHYRTPDGVTRTWEAYERAFHGAADREVDSACLPLGTVCRSYPIMSVAVEVFPVLFRKGHLPCVVLVSQFRPAAGGFCVELPGGLVDKVGFRFDSVPLSTDRQVCRMRMQQQQACVS